MIKVLTWEELQEFAPEIYKLQAALRGSAQKYAHPSYTKERLEQLYYHCRAIANKQGWTFIQRDHDFFIFSTQ